MLETVSRGFKSARNRLAGKSEITEESISEAVRDIRVALLEADVDFNVAKAFVARVREKAIGEVVPLTAKKAGKRVRVTASDHFIKICHDELEALMGPVEPGLTWAAKGPTKVMMVGLQGSGKTTTAAKLASKFLRQGKKPLLVAADIYRPAAVDQLQQLGKRLEVPVYHERDLSPPELCERAMARAREGGHDLVIFDTAGRLAIDEAMMHELDEVKRRTQPENILLVTDAMIGQDAVRTAEEFNRRLELTGFVMTKLDGDARGGAALSIKEVTGKPIKFLGMGEGLDKLEDFRPEGLASRILGFGDIVGLMQDFEQHVDEETAEKDADKILSGNFDLDDFIRQVKLIQKMGSLSDLLEKFPMFGELPEGFTIDDRELKRVESMVSSMTRHERSHPDVIDGSRIKRIAKGSGHKDVEVKGLLDRFNAMRELFRRIGPMGGAGLLSRLPGVRNLSMLKQLQGRQEDLADLFGGLPGASGMPGMPGMMPGLGQEAPPMMSQAQMDRARMFGYQQQSAPKPISDEEKERRKLKRKNEKKARKKTRRK